MSADDDLRLTELLCARLCHDLAGPIAGAAAGVELLSDSDGPDAEDVRLLADSVATAAALLKFLRAALGHGTVPFPTAELKSLADGLLPPGGAVQLSWQDGRGEWPRPLGKLALTLLLVARDALPRGGGISVRLDAGTHIEVTAAGPALAAEEAMNHLAASSAAALGPRAAPACYAARLASAAGARLDAEARDGTLRLSVTA